jgi:hypothetical protein
VTTAGALDVGLCESLAARVSGGDGDARRLLLEHLWPVWLKMVAGSRRMGSLARSEDHVRNVAVHLIEKLEAVGNKGFRQWLDWRERNPDKTFGDWLRILTVNTIRDYVREQLGGRPESADEPSAKRLLNEFASSLGTNDRGVRPPITAAETARELFEFARARLPNEQFVVLALWLEGKSFDEMRTASPAEAQRLLRAGVAVLRRHFAVSTSPAA